MRKDKRCSDMPATGCGCPPLDYRPCHMPRMTIQHAFSSATPVTGDRCSRDDFKMASQAAPWRRSLSSCEGSCCTATVEHPLRHRCAVAPARTHSPEHATLWCTTWPPPPPTPHLLHVLPVPAALILTTSSLLTRLCVSCSCRSTFGHHLLGVPDRILPRIGSPPIARGCASPRRPVYFPPLSAAHHDVVGPRAVFATPPCPHRCPPRRLHGHGQLPPRFGASRGAPRPLEPPDPRFSCVRIRAATYPPMAHSTPCCPHYACRRIADCVPATPIPVAGLPPPGAPPPRPLACSPESGRAVGAGRRARPGPPDLPPTGRQAAPLAAERAGGPWAVWI